MNKYWAQSQNEVLKELKVNAKKGLTQLEVKKRQEEKGLNKLKEKEGKSLVKMVLEQFKDFLIIILIIASVLSIILGDYVEGIVILVIVVLNAILGVVQEKRASNALSALKNMAAPKAKVIRESKLSIIDSQQLVPGDIVSIELGDYIPADIRLIEAVNLRIEEAALTGESLAVEKDANTKLEDSAGIGDRVNTAYMSTIVTYGRGKGVVTNTGMDTEVGKIATMLGEVEDEQTPLQKKIASFGKMLGILCLCVCAVIFVIGIVRQEDIFEFFMIAISLAVAAIPEGLPAVVTVVLAIGMQSMIKRNAIIKKLGAVETLGSTSVICSDKTGTLTQNKMTVEKIFDGEENWELSSATEASYSLESHLESDRNKNIGNLDKLMLCATLCNDSELKGEEIIGDPTEGALIVMSAKAGFDYKELNEKYPRLEEYPFDSERKLMSTLHNINYKMTILTKGAPDVILSRSTKILVNNKIEDMTDSLREKINLANENYAKKALRVLGFGMKIVSEGVDLQEEENELIFLGLVGMIDPPREEVKDGVPICKIAGIRVVMITGDHKITGSAIAMKLGIINKQNQAMEGKEIDNYSEEEFKEKVNDINVFARVSPEHKVRIVEAIRSNNKIVAMTGDGVNDAPALKKADIGIAMGITGTDVSKEAADMILTDDNFTSIVDAVKEGRIIYSNIRKFIGFLLSCNIGEILIIFLAILFGWPVPLVAIQLLWINLITDSFPAFALGLETGEEDIMNKKPRNPNESIVDSKMKIAIAFQSIGLGLAVLLSFYIGYKVVPGSNEVLGRTFCFTTLIIGEMLRAYSARSEDKTLLKMKVFSNKFLNYSVLIAIVLLFMVIYIEPLQIVFETTYLEITNLLIAIGLAIVPLIFGEFSKLLKKI